MITVSLSFCGLSDSEEDSLHSDKVSIDVSTASEECTIESALVFLQQVSSIPPIIVVLTHVVVKIALIVLLHNVILILSS